MMANRHIAGVDANDISARLSTLKAQQEERLAQRRAELYQLPYINLVTFPVDASVLGMVLRKRAEAAGTVLFFKKGNDVRVGVINPDRDSSKELIKELADKFGVKIQVHVISYRSLKVALSRYSIVAKRHALVKGEMTVSEQQLNSLGVGKALLGLSELGEKVTKVTPTELASIIMAGAINMGASDIHIEPMEEQTRMRYRIDGVLQDTATFGLEGWRQLLSRVKVLAGLKLNVHNVPQEGSFVLVIGDEKYDVRVSILPGGNGEYIALRLLGRKMGALRLTALGMKERDYEVVLNELKQSTGMVLAAGPTGSGKTTTIAACLVEVNEPELKIITLEDPIEYRIKGIDQTEIDTDAGYTFAVGLRTILRQDPDIIFVGEMRDVETAEAGVHAAMTGHLVFSTLHANDAPGVILRLLDIGVQPFVIAPALNLIIAQRLVRVVCAKCAEEYKVDKKLKEHLRDVMAGVASEVFDPAVLDKEMLFLRAKGCEECRGTGYKGRTGVFELLIVKDEVEELILRGADSNGIREAAIRQGMTTIVQDVHLKVFDRVTTVEEVKRVSEE